MFLVITTDIFLLLIKIILLNIFFKIKIFVNPKLCSFQMRFCSLTTQGISNSRGCSPPVCVCVCGGGLCYYPCGDLSRIKYSRCRDLFAQWGPEPKYPQAKVF